MALTGHIPHTLFHRSVGENCPAHLPQHGPAFFHERLFLPGASLVVQLCVFRVRCLNVQSSDRSNQETLILFIYLFVAIFIFIPAIFKSFVFTHVKAQDSKFFGTGTVGHTTLV